MPDKTKIYFASDLHLGVPNKADSLHREKLFIEWLDIVRQDATEIYLVGDLFDFWHEYKTAIPKGFTRLFGKLAEITDSGIPIHYFKGNHDLWMYGYFEDELNIPVYSNPIQIEYNGKKFFIGHGDGLGPGDNGYKFIKKVFTNPLCQWLFRWVHPDIGIKVANFFSGRSRNAQKVKEEKFLGEENEWLAIYSKEQLKKEHFDFFIFGHRHLPLDIQLNENSRYINLGDWISHFTYAEFDGEILELKKFETS